MRKFADRKFKKLFEDIVCSDERLNGCNTDIQSATNEYPIFIAAALVLICLFHLFIVCVSAGTQLCSFSVLRQKQNFFLSSTSLPYDHKKQIKIVTSTI